MRAPWLVLLLLAAPLAGCLDSDDPEPTPTTTPPVTPNDGVFIHTVGNGTQNGTARAMLMEAAGTYYPIGTNTFEPTIGATSTGALFTTTHRPVGVDGGARIHRSTDNGQNWEDVTPLLPTGQKVVPNSNDPYIYVDPWTDRVYDFDMCITLSGFCASYSDDDGATWTHFQVAAGVALDHQSLASAPPTGDVPTTLYENVLVYCVNRGTTATGAWCSSSGDGGITWTPMVPGFPVGSAQCSGLHGHVTGSAEGTFYRGNPSCAGPAVYRSDDGGLTWSEHTITTDVGTQGHEIAVGADDQGGVYAFWIGDDRMPYLAVSHDRAETWTTYDVAPEGLTNAGFPTLAAGAPGHVAFAYIATLEATGDDAWHGFIGVSVDALSESPTIANVQVNADDDPLDSRANCGQIRCGGFGDFIDITIDHNGRPWAALAHNGHNNAGIVGTLTTGPALNGNGTLERLPPGGAAVWG